MLIGDLAAASGLSREALRFYERQGLIRARRLDNGYRDYPAEAVALVQYIRTAQQLGFTLAEIGDRLPASGTHPTPAPRWRRCWRRSCRRSTRASPHCRCCARHWPSGWRQTARCGRQKIHEKQGLTLTHQAPIAMLFVANYSALALDPSPRYSQGTSSRRWPSKRIATSRPQRTGPVVWKMRPLRSERACTRAARSQRLRA